MEKLANHIALQNITEGGMEKKAMNVLQLLRMGRNFALRGKLDRFNTLMDRRAYAAASSVLRDKRYADWLKANDAHNRLKGYLLDSDVNPALGKMRKTYDRLLKNPVDIADNPNPAMLGRVDDAAKHNLADLLSEPDYIKLPQLNRVPTYNPRQLESFGRVLKQLDPELHKKVLTTGSF